MGLWELIFDQRGSVFGPLVVGFLPLRVDFGSLGVDLSLWEFILGLLESNLDLWTLILGIWESILDLWESVSALWANIVYFVFWRYFFGFSDQYYSVVCR